MKNELKYFPPKIDVYVIHLEEGIAVGSARVQFLGPNNETPNVENWDLTPNDGTDNPNPWEAENW